MSGKIDSADDSSHYPGTGEPETWQESWALAWYDPVQRIGGYQHLGLQRPRKMADAWSWIAWKGECVHKFHNNQLPLPADDFSDLRLGPFHLKSEIPLRKRAVRIRNREVDAALVYEALTDPISVSYESSSGHSSDVARNHFEDMGRITGTIEVRGQSIPVRAFAFQDRSWGPRDWSKVFSYRLVWACFSEDHFVSLLHFVGPHGPNQWGYVYEKGRISKVRSMELRVEIGGDGITPLTVRAGAWIADGTGLQLEGTCEGGSVQTQRDGFMMFNGACTFSYGGRMGTGFIEVCELKKLTPALQALQDAAAQ